MASSETLLMTRVALAENWPVGWLTPRAADGWPEAALALLPELQENIGY